MVTTSILLVINKVCGYLDNIRYIVIISVADSCCMYYYTINSSSCNEYLVLPSTLASPLYVITHNKLPPLVMSSL